MMACSFGEYSPRMFMPPVEYHSAVWRKSLAAPLEQILRLRSFVLPGTQKGTAPFNGVSLAFSASCLFSLFKRSTAYGGYPSKLAVLTLKRRVFLLMLTIERLRVAFGLNGTNR